MHCSKSLVRSKLWSPETWEHAKGAPSLAQWVKSTVETDETLEQVQGNHDRDRETRLYQCEGCPTRLLGARRRIALQMFKGGSPRMMKTDVCERLGIDLPIILAPMAGAVGPELAAAVSNAGGLGILPLWRADPDTLRAAVRETRSLTAAPFAVNLNMEFPQEELLEACLEEGVPIISFFWRDPGDLVARAKAGGAVVMHTVGDAEAARRAVDGGVDVIVA